MQFNKKPFSWKKPGHNFLFNRAMPISSFPRAAEAAMEAVRCGASGRTLQFALKTITNRIKAAGNEATLPAIKHIEEKRIEIIKKRKLIRIKTKKPAVEWKPVAENPWAKKQRPKLFTAMKAIEYFVGEHDLTKRYNAFTSLTKMTEKEEYRAVCSWLESKARYFEGLMETEKYYSRYADYADIAMRFNAAATVLYTNFGHEKKAIERLKKGQELLARTGLV